MTNRILGRSARPLEKHNKNPPEICAQVAERSKLHPPAGCACGDAPIVQEARAVMPVRRAGQRPFLANCARLVERSVVLKVRAVAAHERRHRLGARERYVSGQSPETPPEPGSESRLPGA